MAEENKELKHAEGAGRTGFETSMSTGIQAERKVRAKKADNGDKQPTAATSTPGNAPAQPPTGKAS